MINEVFVIETDKNGQIGALDFGCLEIFFFVCAKPGRRVDMFVPVNNYSGSGVLFVLNRVIVSFPFRCISFFTISQNFFYLKRV